MRNGTNLFFLAIAAGFAWWAWTEWQKQKDAQARIAAAAANQPYPDELLTIDPATLPQRRVTDWTAQAAIYGG